MPGGFDLFLAAHRQMAFGERAAVEGLVAALRPALANRARDAGRWAASPGSPPTAPSWYTFDREPTAAETPGHVHFARFPKIAYVDLGFVEIRRAAARWPSTEAASWWSTRTARWSGARTRAR